jgi:hypothetical protein
LSTSTSTATSQPAVGYQYFPQYFYDHNGVMYEIVFEQNGDDGGADQQIEPNLVSQVEQQQLPPPLEPHLEPMEEDVQQPLQHPLVHRDRPLIPRLMVPTPLPPPNDEEMRALNLKYSHQRFPFKLWHLASDETFAPINWSKDGAALLIDHMALEPVLSYFFRSKKFSSFLRQLHLYGFRKVTRAAYQRLPQATLQGKSGES